MRKLAGVIMILAAIFLIFMAGVFHVTGLLKWIAFSVVFGAGVGTFKGDSWAFSLVGAILSAAICLIMPTGFWISAIQDGDADFLLVIITAVFLLVALFPLIVVIKRKYEWVKPVKSGG